MIRNGLSLEQVYNVAISELRRATVDRKHSFRTVVLSTFDGSRVDARTVVFRVLGQADEVIIYTDSRSAKCHALRQYPDASLLWYHPGKRCQIKAQVRVQIHHQDQVAQHYWQKVQGEGQKSYLSVLAPGSQIQSPDDAWQWDEPHHQHFAVLSCHIENLEILQLDGIIHLRAFFEKFSEKIIGKWITP